MLKATLVPFMTIVPAAWRELRLATVPTAKLEAPPAYVPNPMILLSPLFQPPGAARLTVTNPLAGAVVRVPVTLNAGVPAATVALTVAAPAKFNDPIVSA